MQAKNHFQKHLDSHCLKLPILNCAAVELGENRSQRLHKNSFGLIEVFEHTLDFDCGIQAYLRRQVSSQDLRVGRGQAACP